MKKLCAMLFSLVILSCSDGGNNLPPETPADPGAPSGDSIDLTGNTVTNADKTYAYEVLKFSDPSVSAEVAEQKFRQALEKTQVLVTSGFSITRADLERESNRIDATTLYPARLALLKAQFGDDHDMYLRIFVLPVYVDRVLPFEFFPNNQEIHAGRLAVAQLLLQAAVSAGAAALEGLATTAGASWRQIILGAPTSTAEILFWTSNVIQHTASGQVLNRVVESETAFCVAGNRGQNGDGFFVVDLACVQKVRYDEWLNEQYQNLGLH